MTAVKRKTLVLDLDETLVHSRGLYGWFEYKSTETENKPDFVFKAPRHINEMRVYKRPGVDKFLDTVSEWYNLVIYTAGFEDYATPILDYLDNGRNIILRRYFSQHCGYCHSKNLILADKDLSNVVLLDNSPNAYINFPENGIPIESWYEDKNDKCLKELIPMFDKMRFCDDVRTFLKEYKRSESKDETVTL